MKLNVNQILTFKIYLDRSSKFISSDWDMERLLAWIDSKIQELGVGLGRLAVWIRRISKFSILHKKLALLSILFPSIRPFDFELSAAILNVTIFVRRDCSFVHSCLDKCWSDLLNRFAVRCSQWRSILPKDDSKNLESAKCRHLWHINPKRSHTQSFLFSSSIFLRNPMKNHNSNIYITFKI
jgi:hypothetical protein